MANARIVTRHYDEAVPVAERLKQLGYTVEIFDPDQLRLSDADLELELDLLPAAQALREAGRRARRENADVFVDRGTFAAEEPTTAQAEELGQPRVAAQLKVDAAPAAPLHEPEPEHIADTVQNTVVQFGAAFSEARGQISESAADAKARARSAVDRLRSKFEEKRGQLQAAREERRLLREEAEERKRVELEREAARRMAELQSRRAAEEEERRLRAQELAYRQRQEDEERRRMQEEERRAAAARAAIEAERAEQARAEQLRREQERQRIEEEWRAREAERMRVEEQRRAEETERARAVEAQRLQAAQERPQAGTPPAQVREPDPVATEIARRVYRASQAPRARAPQRVRPRHLASRRERQWQRAAFYASVVALVVMLGFVFAMHQSTPASPTANLLPQNAVEQQVPFGAAKAVPRAPLRTAAPVAPAVPLRTAAQPARKPSAARRHGRGGVAEDEVIVHHYGQQRAKNAPAAGTSAGVRHFSDME